MNIVLNKEKIENINSDLELVLIKNKKNLNSKIKKVLDEINFFSSAYNCFVSQNEKKLYIYVNDKSNETFKIAFSKALNSVKSYNIDSIKLDIVQLKKELKINNIVEGILLGTYTFNKYLNDKKKNDIKIIISTYNSITKYENLKKKLAYSLSLSNSVNYVRDIVNSAPEDYYPKVMASDALKIAEDSKINCEVYGEDYLQEVGMNAMYSVGKASRHESQLIHLSYKPKKPKAKIVLVGKGLTYDTGGLSLKRGEGMISMKCDKGGASALLGVMKFLSENDIDIEVHSILGAVENMIGGDAYKPDDVLKTYSGKTVEVTNTDAEGRLVLADCLTYAQKNIKDIDYIFDFATLTGASIGAFGGYTTAVMGYNEKIKKLITKASNKSGELVGFLPFNQFMENKLKSSIADMTNTSSNKNGGAITASLFLSNFIEKENKNKWLHFDIAGPSYRKETWGYNPYGATGCAVRLVVRFLENINK